VHLWRRWSFGYNTLEKGSAKIKKSRTEQMKLWRKHNLGVSLKKDIILSILIRRFSPFLQGRNERFL